MTEKSAVVVLANESPSPPPKRQITRTKQVLLQIFAGGTAGFVENLFMQPLDTVKTRMQLQSKTSEDYCSNTYACLSKMAKKEGVLSFWKGVLPPILVATPKRAIKFLCFEQAKPFFMYGRKEESPMTFVSAGLTAGFVTGMFVNPFEKVKVVQQADKAKMKEAPSALATLRKIIREEGIGSNGLNKGLTATLGRTMTFNTIYFGWYHSLKYYLPVFENETLDMIKKTLFAFSAGTLASSFSITFDVVKSRIQAPQPDPPKYVTTFATFKTLIREEGFFALYKGLEPKMIRYGIGGGIMLIAFDEIYAFMKNATGW